VEHLAAMCSPPIGRGEALARRCEEQLAGARDRVKAVLEHADDPRPE
jgi:exonuclease VII small subunit